MNVKQLMYKLDALIPLNKAENWDNVGLLIGDEDVEVTSILTTLDCTLEVAQEAMDKGANTIISHHPLIFNEIKSISNSGYDKVIRFLINNDIQLIAMHTNLDAHPQGVNDALAKKIGFDNVKQLNIETELLTKLNFTVPVAHAEKVKEGLSAAGAGSLGDYTNCFFEVAGIGQFMPTSAASPHIGQANVVEHVEELKIDCVFHKSQTKKIVQKLIEIHPYEEVAYDTYNFPVEGLYGLGVIGEYNEAIPVESLIKTIKSNLKLDKVSLIGDSKKIIKTVGIIGGAAIDYKDKMKEANVDVFLTGDIKYHEAHDLLMDGLTTIDISHYAEYVMKEALANYLKHHIEVDIQASTTNTNPFKVY